MVTLFKNEKGAGALKKLQDGSSSAGGLKVKSSVKAAKPASKAKKSLGVSAASKIIGKASAKKSVAKVGKSVPRLMTPGDKGSAKQTPAVSKSNFAKMKAMLLAQRKVKK